MDTLTLLKRRLLERLKKAIAPLKFSKEDYNTVIVAFDISFESHRFAPHRASGEIYFMHVFRQTIRMARLMKRYHVSSANLLAAILLHDAIEDAEKGKTSRFMVRSEIHLRVNDTVVYYVLSLTKRKPIDTREEYLIRITLSEVWEVLVAKPADCHDNIITLAATPIETQAMKVREVFEHYPKMRERAIHLITMEGACGNLPLWCGWVALVNNLHRNLKRSAKKQQQRLERAE